MQSVLETLQKCKKAVEDLQGKNGPINCDRIQMQNEFEMYADDEKLTIEDALTNIYRCFNDKSTAGEVAFSVLYFTAPPTYLSLDAIKERAAQ
jgi:hypothetical protein